MDSSPAVANGVVYVGSEDGKVYAYAPAPTTTVLTPTDNATVSGANVVLDASASAGTTSVVYRLSGGTLANQVIATATPTYYGWIATWDSTSVPNGTYQLQSVASYSGGTSGTSPPITITVNNPPPSTFVGIPANNATVTGTGVVLDAGASPGVTSVVYQLSGGTLTNQVIATATPTYYGWIAVWNSTSVPNGTYALRSVASYSGGVSGTSAAITVTVAN